jgi:hypothetical protein
LVLADSSDNIGYFLASPSLTVKNDVTYLGTAVLDGSTSDFDCSGLVPI